MVDKAEMERIIQRGLAQNRHVEGNRIFRMRRRDDLDSGTFNFQPAEGSLT